LNPRGLVLVGEPGSGKTRAAWLLIRRSIFANCRVITFDGLGWGLAVSSHFGDSETVEDWINGLCCADVLFIDDIFKAKMTEAQEFAIFGVLDRRAAWKRPTIVTMNASGAALASRATDAGGERDRMEAIMRRLGEFSDVIRFAKPK
jgi:DNA replication protein DnaC